MSSCPHASGGTLRSGNRRWPGLRPFPRSHLLQQQLAPDWRNSPAAGAFCANLYAALQAAFDLAGARANRAVVSGRGLAQDSRTTRHCLRHRRGLRAGDEETDEAQVKSQRLAVRVRALALGGGPLDPLLRQLH
jgi:hypothetical protein